jgi:arylsulfatase A-like enzyme
MSRPRWTRGLLYLPGLLWTLTVVLTFGVFDEARPGRPLQWAGLVLLAVAVGVVHAGAFATLAALARRTRQWTDVVLALAAGGLYALFALSLVKFSILRSHLRFEDLWFLATSAKQAAGEGTASERTWLGGAVLLPLVLALLLFALLAAARRRATAPTARCGLALAGGGLIAVAAVLSTLPSARWAATILLPDTSAVSRGLERLLTPRPAWSADPARHLRLQAGEPAAPPQPAWNVLVLMLESVPWKRLYGPDARPESTPELFELARRAIVFDRAWAVSTHSDYAQTSILASLFPRKSDAHDYFFRLDYPRALPWDVLAPHGWRTAVASSQNERWGNMIAFLATPRLGRLRHAPDYPDAPRRGEGSETKVYEEAVVDDVLAWIAERPETPFVAYVNFQATHYPYMWPDTFPPPYGPAPIDFSATLLEYPRDKIPLMLDRFHNALAYVDFQVGRLVDGLAAAGLLERTALLVVADHGEAFYEHGLPTHGTAMHEEQLRVPMLALLPGEMARRVREPVSTLDLLPSLYRRLGLPRRPELQGHDGIFEPDYRGARRPLFFSIQGMTREDGVSFDGWKLLANHDRHEAALFDLGSDPFELNSLTAREPAQVRALHAHLAGFLELQLGYYGARGWEAGWGPPALPGVDLSGAAAAAGTP